VNENERVQMRWVLVMGLRSISDYLRLLTSSPTFFVLRRRGCRVQKLYRGVQCASLTGPVQKVQADNRF
jgi:hypothetical protein